MIFGESQVFVESLDRTFENVCELDLVFHFDEVGILIAIDISQIHPTDMEVHHILTEIIQGGLVLETNVDEIDLSGLSFLFSTRKPLGTALPWIGP